METKHAEMDKGCKSNQGSCVHIKYEWEVLGVRKHWIMNRVGSLLIRIWRENILAIKPWEHFQPEVITT